MTKYKIKNSFNQYLYNDGKNYSFTDIDKATTYLDRQLATAMCNKLYGFYKTAFELEIVK